METSIQEQADAEIKVVNAQLNYLAEATPKPVNYAYDPPAGVPRRSGKYVAQTVAIRNGRELLSKFSLDTNGFVLTEHETAVKDFYDPDEVKSVYYPEVRAPDKAGNRRRARGGIRSHRAQSGCSRNAAKRALARRPSSCTTTTASNLRRAASATICRKKLIACSRIASPKSTSGARFAARSKARLWRCATPAAWAPEDIVPIDLVYRERVGEIFGFLYNPKHRWYYFPRMERNEAILLKCYDSKDDGRARFTAHTSFEDPNSPPNAAPRESIEVRALVFWPPETA